MKIKTLFMAACLFLTASCSMPTAAPTVTAASSPTKTPHTATAIPVFTETIIAVVTSSNVFGMIPLNSVQAFSIEPVAKAAFEEALRGFTHTGSIRDFRVDRVAVFPSGDGNLIAEIFYSLQADSDLWPEDGGVAGPDGWITGKCSRFDLVATEIEHQLKNKRLCN